MADITASVRTSAATYQVDVTLVSSTVISDPAAYVQTDSVSAEILARAGLDADLEFVSAVLQFSSAVSNTYTYSLIVTYGDEPCATTSHTHDSTTVDLTWRDTYLNGPDLVVDATRGPALISHPNDTSTDYFRIRTDTSTTTRDLFAVKQGSIIRVGAHTEFYLDNTYDIGTPDGGATLRRPRDVRLARNLLVGANATVTGSGAFSSYVLSTHNRFTAQATNPDNTPTTRHVYVNSTDDSLHYWDGSSDIVLAAGAGTSGDTVGQWTCPAGVSIGDVVVPSGAGNVVKANATTLGVNDLAGVVVAKPTATIANVKYVGETGAIFGGALTPGKTYYLDRVDGGITDVLTGFVEGDTLYRVGLAKDTNILVVLLGKPFTK